MSPQIENIRCDESTGPPFIKRCGLRLHESLNPPAGGPWASAAPRSVHSQWGKQKDVCSEPPGQGEPLINRHVLRAGGRPGNSLLCFNCIVGRETRGVHAAQRAAGNRAWRGAPQPALPRPSARGAGVCLARYFAEPGSSSLLLLGSPRPCDMLTMSLRAAWSPPCPFSTPLCSRGF